MNGWCLLLVCMGVAMVQVEGELSAFIKAKIHQHFVLADCDKSGQLQFKDYICIVDNIMKLAGYTKYTPDEFHNVVAVNAWNAFPNAEITEQQYNDIVATKDPADIAFAARNLSQYMFDAWNQLNIQGMNRTELKNEYYSLGKKIDLDKQGEDAEIAMDTDKNGYVSKSEYQDCAAKFLTVDDPNDASQYFFGDLNVQ